MSARHFEIIKRPELIVPEAALRRRHICYSGSKPPVLTFLDQSAVLNGSGSHSHSGLSFGPAASDRAIIALCSAQSVSPFTMSVVIGGVAGTKCAEERISTPNVNASSTGIWIAAVPSGTSGTVVVSGMSSGNVWSGSVAVYSVVGLKSLTPTDTDSARDFNGSSFDPTVTTSVEVQSAGVLVSSAMIGGSTSSSATWTGATQDFDVNTSALRYSGGSLTSLTVQTVTVTTKWGTLVGKIAATASFR